MIPPTYGELARLANGIGPPVAVLGEEGNQPVERDALADRDAQHAAAKQLARRNTLDQRIDRREDDAAKPGLALDIGPAASACRRGG